MSLSRRIFTEKLLAAVVFIPLTILFSKLMSNFLVQSGTAARFQQLCSPSLTPSPNQLNYTGIQELDRRLCGLVTFFDVAMKPPNVQYTTEVMACLATFATIPYIEAARNGRSPVLALPVLVGLLYQFCTIALVYPLYWLAFIWTGGSSLHKRPGGEHTKVDQAHAEGILFSIFIGFFIPTACMFVLEDPYVTAMWQAFPLWMTLSQFGHRFFRPSSRYPYSGFPTVRASYIILFIVASSYHIAIVWPRFQDPASLKHLFIPIMSPDSNTTTLETGVLEFLKLDGAFGTVSIALATLWFARNVKEFLLLVVWYLVTIVVIGPGAAVAGVFLWRENILNSQRPVEADSKDSGKSQ